MDTMLTLYNGEHVMKNCDYKQPRRFIYAVGLLVFILGLFPPAKSFYGEAYADGDVLTDGEILELTAREALQALEGGGLTAARYVDVLLAQAARYEDYHAFIYLNPAQVRAAAAQSDQVRASGGPLGPLHGLPIVFKDNINTAASTLIQPSVLSVILI